nr:DUF2516 family protein [Nocardioides agariphilus]
MLDLGVERAQSTYADSGLWRHAPLGRDDQVDRRTRKWLEAAESVGPQRIAASQSGGRGVQHRCPRLLVGRGWTGVVDEDTFEDPGELPAPHHALDVVVTGSEIEQLAPRHRAALTREQAPHLHPIHGQHQIEEGRRPQRVACQPVDDRYPEPVMDVFAVEGYTMLLIEIGLLAVKIYAFVSSLRFSDEAYRAAGKLNKAAWTIILGLGVAAQVVLAGAPLNLINLALTIAALVYLADVKPALSSLTRR